jgi:hypothetical protein
VVSLVWRNVPRLVRCFYLLVDKKWPFGEGNETQGGQLTRRETGVTSILLRSAPRSTVHLFR